MVLKKTWSRETALALFGILCWAMYKENIPLVEVIIWPITGYGTVAFGLKRIDDSPKLFRDQPS